MQNPSAPPEIVATWKKWNGPKASKPVPCPILPNREVVTILTTDRAKVVPVSTETRREVDIGHAFDRVVVINLHRRPDRLRMFHAHRWPFAKVQTFPAIDAKWATLGGNAAAACMLSHMSVLAQAIADDLESVLVFEDDAEPVEGFAEKLQAFLERVPSDWECLMLGGQLFDESQSVDCGNGVRAVSHCERLHAYALNRSGMRSLMEYWSKCVGHCDHRIAEWQDAGHKAYAPSEFIVAQSAGQSDITFDNQPRRMFGVNDPRPIQKAVPDNLAVLTIGCYGPEEVGGRLAILQESAALWKIPLTVLGVGEDYISHHSAKVARMQAWIDKLPSHITHIVYLDGKDTFFNGSAYDLCDVLNATPDLVRVGLESTCWPDGSMATKFETFPHGRNYINAGVFAGERRAVMNLLGALSALHARLFDDTERHNDQHLWNHARIEGLRMKPDHEGLLAANTYALDGEVPPNAQFDLRDGRIVWRDNGNVPCIVHFSGQDGTRIAQWWAHLRGKTL